MMNKAYLQKSDKKVIVAPCQGGDTDTYAAPLFRTCRHQQIISRSPAPRLYRKQVDIIMHYKNILKEIGNTPIVPINRLNPFKDVTIYAKLEAFNPGGSIKDRIALSMI